MSWNLFLVQNILYINHKRLIFSFYFSIKPSPSPLCCYLYYWTLMMMIIMYSSAIYGGGRIITRFNIKKWRIKTKFKKIYIFYSNKMKYNIYNYFKIRVPTPSQSSKSGPPPTYGWVFLRRSHHKNNRTYIRHKNNILETFGF